MGARRRHRQTFDTAHVVADPVAGETADRLERVAASLEISARRIRILDHLGLAHHVLRDGVDLGCVANPELSGLVDPHVPELRHTIGTERVGILDPAIHPVLAGLGSDLGEIGARLANPLPALDLVAAVAAEALDEDHPLVELRRLRHHQLVLVAFQALGLRVPFREHRRIPVMQCVVLVVA